LGDSKEVTIEFDDFGFVKGYSCPHCGGKVKESHVDDMGTRFFKCEKCGQYSTRLKTQERESLEQSLKGLEEVRRPTNLEEIGDVLNSTIKHDRENKLITFLSMLLTYTEEDQINVSSRLSRLPARVIFLLSLVGTFRERT